MVTLASNRQLVYELPVGAGGSAEELDDGSVNLHTAAKLEMQDATEEEAATLTVWMATGGHYQLRYEPSEHEGYAAGTAVLRAWHAFQSPLPRTSVPSRHAPDGEHSRRVTL